MRIFIVSNSPWTPSGYGQQTRMLSERLKAQGHEIAILCYFGLEGGIINVNGITCFPKRYHPYGNDVLIAHSMNWHADIVISLMDTWVMNVEEYPPPLRWVPWYPVDHDPMPALVRQKLNLAHKRIAMS